MISVYLYFLARSMGMLPLYNNSNNIIHTRFFCLGLAPKSNKYLQSSISLL